MSVNISAQEVANLRKLTNAGMMDCKKALVESQGDVQKAIALLKDWGIAKAVKKEGRETTQGIIFVHAEGKSGSIVEINCETDFVSATEEFQSFARDIFEQIIQKKVNAVENIPEDIQMKLKEGAAQFGEHVTVSRIASLEAKDYLGSHTHAKKVGVLVNAEVKGDVDDIVKDAIHQVAVHISAMEVLAVSEEELNQDLVQEKRKEFEEETKKEGKPENILAKIVEGKMLKWYKECVLYHQEYLFNEKQTVKEYIQEASKKAGKEIHILGYKKVTLGA